MRGGQRQGPFATQWGEYRRRRRRDTLAFVGVLALPLAMAVGFVLRRGRLGAGGGGPGAGWLTWAAVAAWVAVCGYHAIASYREDHWPCPRCGRPYFVAPSGLRRYRPGARQCANCGLPKWAGEEPAPSVPA